MGASTCGRIHQSRHTSVDAPTPPSDQLVFAFLAPPRGPFPGPPLTILGLALTLFQPSANPLDACCLTIGLAYISAHAYCSVPHSCAAPASPSVHPPGWLARLRRPPPFIRLAGLRGSGVPLRSSAWLACTAPASPAVHPPGWLARLRRPPPFIRLAGLRGSGVPLHSSAWLARLWLPPPFIRLPSQTDSHSIYFITGGGGPNGHVRSQGQGGLWIYPHWLHPQVDVPTIMDTPTSGRTHHNGYTHKWTHPHHGYDHMWMHPPSCILCGCIHFLRGCIHLLVDFPVDTSTVGTPTSPWLYPHFCLVHLWV
ncbi:hypothetical protein B0H11DRAFT_1921369 [Mycena galericulata]|nr:hypothetical protein B0H11DRAFT_1921369 [Mycena galericulata]